MSEVTETNTEAVDTLKETKEFLHGAIALGRLLAKNADKGWKGDITLLAKRIVTDQAFAAELKTAIIGVEKIPAEITSKDELPIEKIMEIGQTVYAAIREPI